MNRETAFDAASTLAFAGWVLRAAAPQSARMLGIVRYGIVGLIRAAVRSSFEHVLVMR